jgi:hypothetical protein
MIPVSFSLVASRTWALLQVKHGRFGLREAAGRS